MIGSLTISSWATKNVKPFLVRKNTISTERHMPKLSFSLWCKLGFDYLPLRIYSFKYFFCLLVVRCRGSLFLKTVTVNDVFRAFLSYRLIFWISQRTSNDIEFRLPNKRQVSISLLWFGVVGRDIFVFAYEFSCSCKLNGFLGFWEYMLLVAHFLYVYKY